MRTIIAGSRGVTDYRVVVRAVEDAEMFLDLKITTVVSGTARGVDQLGERYAQQHGLPITRYPADWDGLGKRAGYVCNALMAKNADALVAVWDGRSPGTKHMIDLATSAGLLVYVHNMLSF